MSFNGVRADDRNIEHLQEETLILAKAEGNSRVRVTWSKWVSILKAGGKGAWAEKASPMDMTLFDAHGGPSTALIAAKRAEKGRRDNLNRKRKRGIAGSEPAVAPTPALPQ